MSDQRGSILQPISKTRYDNARQLVQEAGSQVAMRKIVNRSQSQISQILGRNPSKAIGNSMARWLEQCFKKEYGWLDHAHSRAEYIAYSANMERSSCQLVPHISWQQLTSWDGSSEFSECLQLVTSHKVMGSSAFVLQVKDNLMHNAEYMRSYPENSWIFVDPDAKVAHNDYVIAEISGNVVFKKLLLDEGMRALALINKSMENYIHTNDFNILGRVEYGIV
jgi:SOS-response transcriptional repressor LexA